MYLEHFGLRELPFGLTPHTEFFFSGSNRGATLEALIYAATHDEGIVKVSGEVGSGKTMLCRMLLEKLSDTVVTIYLANPSLSCEEILYTLADELQVPYSDERPYQLLHSLQDRLIELYATGRQVMVIVDEAHAMPPETLEEIRLLSNLESNRHKLLHIILFGQPELDKRLLDTTMRQLKERITHNFALEPLHRSDIASYLMFRIRAAGYRGPDLFTPGAILLINFASEGLTRRINILADKALLCAFSEGKHIIGSKQVKAAIRDAQFNQMHRSMGKPIQWVGGVVLLAILTSLVFIAGRYNATSAPSPILNSSAKTTLNTAVPAVMLSATPPAAIRPPALESRELAVTAHAKTADPTAFADLEERIVATEEWLKITPDSHYVIQLFSTDASHRQAVELFLNKSIQSLDPQQIRVYHSKLSGKDRYGVIYGDYPSIRMANNELSKLLKTHYAKGRYVRSVSKLR